MSEYMFGITYTRPSPRTAKKWDRICKQLGGYGYNEVNRIKGAAPGINNGRYQGWFVAPNHGWGIDDELAKKVLLKINEERPQ